jgi:hypothetical protein
MERFGPPRRPTGRATTVGSASRVCWDHIKDRWALATKILVDHRFLSRRWFRDESGEWSASIPRSGCVRICPSPAGNFQGPQDSSMCASAMCASAILHPPWVARWWETPGKLNTRREKCRTRTNTGWTTPAYPGPPGCRAEHLTGPALKNRAIFIARAHISSLLPTSFRRLKKKTVPFAMNWVKC